MTTIDWFALAAAAVLVGVAGLMASAETVLSRLSLVRALRLAEQDDAPSQAEVLVQLLERRSSTLNVILLVTVTVRTLAAALVAVPIARVWPAWGVVLALAGLVAVGLIVGEIIPRTRTLRNLERTGLRLARPIMAVAQLLSPVAELVVRAGRLLSNRSRGVSGPYAAEEELEEGFDAEEADDELEEDERAMIASIFELGDTVTREIMTPRPDMVIVVDGADLHDVVETVIASGFSRLPVRDSARDELTGVLFAKDLLAMIARQPERTDWSHLVRPTTLVPESRRVDDLLTDLREDQLHQALVVDEFGAVVGLVTIEDILEEIVGEIVDEHDHEEPLLEITEDGMRVDARLPLDDLNELLGKQLPEDGWDTVGGLLLGAMGRVPEVGERVELDGVVFTAESVQGRRIQKIHVAIDDTGDAENLDAR